MLFSLAGANKTCLNISHVAQYIKVGQRVETLCWRDVNISPVKIDWNRLELVKSSVPFKLVNDSSSTAFQTAP